MSTALDFDPPVVIVTPKLVFGACKHGDHGRCKGHSYNAEFVTAWAGEGNKRHAVARGRRYLCGCECHRGQRLACLLCGEVGDAEFEEDRLTDRGHCVDVEACHERQMEYLANHARYQSLLECGRAGAVAKAENNARLALARLDDDGEIVVRKPRGEARPTQGRCQHCGEPTKGGKFVAGHDAKLKGELKRAAEGGDADALVELIVRGWPTHTAKVDADFLAAAVLRQATDQLGETWLAERITARIGA